MGDPLEILPKYLPWLPCRNIKVPDWWCGRCHRSSFTYRGLVDRECPVGPAATAKLKQQARLRSWTQPGRL
eukprot:15438603-Alexandrium_andersonii.AAC.1